MIDYKLDKAKLTAQQGMAVKRLERLSMRARNADGKKFAAANGLAGN